MKVVEIKLNLEYWIEKRTLMLKENHYPKLYINHSAERMQVRIRIRHKNKAENIKEK